MMVGPFLRHAIEHAAENNPNMLKSKLQTKTYLMDLCWRYVKKNNQPKTWDAYLTTIKVLLEEFCVA